jgi:hypothetical protein
MIVQISEKGRGISVAHAARTMSCLRIPLHKKSINSECWLGNLKVRKGGLPPLFCFAHRKERQERGQAALPDLRGIANAQFLSSYEALNDFLCKDSPDYRFKFA